MSDIRADDAARTAPKKEFLTFRLGQEEYCIDILKVQEIRGYEPPTLIANAPAFIKGVINLRGKNGPTVLGTDNVMMAACLAEGVTVIESAAAEPR